MYNEYEDYMRSVLGYAPQYQQYDTYGNIYDNFNSCFPYRDNAQFNESRYQNMYPEIYNILKPMVGKICENRNIDSITEADLENMAQNIYSNIEADIDVVNVNIVTSDSRNENRSGNRPESLNANVNNKDNNLDYSRSGNMRVKEASKEEKRACCGNPTLKDLIKILLLNQLINNKPQKPGFPGRPPMPPHGYYPRPPFRDEYGNQPYMNF